MKISEYIRHLQELKDEHGDVDVEVNRTFECSDLSINDTFQDPELPYYDKERKSVIIYSEFYDYN
jgi:hypothetical protein